MFNITVIKIKDIFKYMLTCVMMVCVIYFVSRYFYGKREKFNINIGLNVKNYFYEKYSLKLIDSSLPEIKYVESSAKNMNENIIEEDDEFYVNDFSNFLLQMELGVFYFKEKKIASNTENAVNEVQESVGEADGNSVENLELASKEEKTEVVTTNPIAENFTQEYNGIKIRNETSFELTDNNLNPNNLSINNKDIIIFHTHTCESYAPSEKYPYEQTGNYRTTDLNYTVSRVGDELEKYLGIYGFNVLHDRTYHDYPAYTGSYSRSLNTVQGLLNQKNSDIIIDLHRDAIGSNSNYDPTVKIGDDYAAQIMFVMGSNGGGLSHPNWQTNLQFAVKIQEKANELYPGLFKPMIFRNSRYNQHLGKAACIIEVGATGNTLEQCLNSMKYLSEVMNEALLK